MPSFEIADCPTRLTLAEGDGGVRTATLATTIRNVTARSRVARISVQREGAAKPDWFRFEGALPTSPAEVERDFGPNASQAVKLVVSVPGGEPAGTHVFRIRVTSEDDTDDDVALAPNVAFDVAATPAKAPEVSKFPWWAVIVAGILVLVIAGGVGYLAFSPSGALVPPIIGRPLGEAQASLDGAKIATEPAVRVIGLDPSRFSGRIVAMEPDECKAISSGQKLKVYIGASIDPYFCRSCINRKLEEMPADLQARIQAGATKTSARYFGVAGATPPAPCR